MASMRQCNLVIAAVAAGVGATIAAYAYGYGIAMTEFGPAAGFWPFLLGVGLVLVAARLLLDTLRRSAELAAQPVELSSEGNFAAYRMMVLVMVYAVCLFVLGFYLATLLFLPACMYLLGLRNHLLGAAVTLLFVAFIYVVFARLLHISLPVPWFLD